MWIKLCGIRDLKTARVAADLGADAVGLNFYPGSPRCVSVETAAEIAAGVRTRVEPIGLFVNAPVDEVARVVGACRLTTVQLHGDEPPDDLAALAAACPGVGLIRAFRVSGDCGEIAGYLRACRSLGVLLRACLVEAKVEGAYGGSGRRAPWDVIASGYRPEWPPLVLAGGLDASNVAEAIRAVGPWGVDVSSGIESSPGVKDIVRMAEFVRGSRAASL